MKIYVVAICGVGVGNLAMLLKEQGHDVRGSEFSEKTYYPPMSELLNQSGIIVDFGFSSDCITRDIDLVILGGAALIHDKNNPQVAKAKELGIRVISYARGVGEFIAKEKSIEVVGNHGKTTTTALIARTLQECHADPSYFIGGAPIGFDKTVYAGAGDWSVCEGDEYPSIGQEPGGKFMYHAPRHILLTSADWDHKNIYTTKSSYVDNYIKLLDILPADGTVTACYNGIDVFKVLKHAQNNINLYTLSLFSHYNPAHPPSSIACHKDIREKVTHLQKNHKEVYKRMGRIYYVHDIDFQWKGSATSKFKLACYDVKSNDVKDLGSYETVLIGLIGIENSLACIATLHGLGFDTDCLQNGIKAFAGVRRKLEVITTHNEYTLINDHAHSPIKIRSALRAVRLKYPKSKIFVIFHVVQSGLKEEKTFHELSDAFNRADYVLIPRVYPDTSTRKKFYGKDYKEVIQQGTQESEYLKPGNVFYTPVITQMKSILENNIKKNDVVIVMSSGDVQEFIVLCTKLRIDTVHSSTQFI